MVDPAARDGPAATGVAKKLARPSAARHVLGHVELVDAEARALRQRRVDRTSVLVATGYGGAAPKRDVQEPQSLSRPSLRPAAPPPPPPSRDRDQYGRPVDPALTRRSSLGVTELDVPEYMPRR